MNLAQFERTQTSERVERMTEQLSELPKSVSAAPIYKQLQKLQLVKADHEDVLVRLRANGPGTFWIEWLHLIPLKILSRTIENS